MSVQNKTVRLPFRLKLATFIRCNIVFFIALAAAIMTSIIVLPDRQYLNYPDYKTLTCLFCTLAVICALKNIRFFTVIAQKIVGLTGNLRRAVIAIVTITFIGSMLIANDMALLTFLPLGYMILTSTGQMRYMIVTFILQNIAANLGGMLTPFGNPQNLYLYNRFSIPNMEFMKIMLIPFLFSIALIFLCCIIFIPSVPISISSPDEKPLPLGRTVLYLLLFAFSLIIVFRLVPFYLGLIVIPIFLLFMDRRALLSVDYLLLLTFLCFFIFAGNMARIDTVSNLLSGILKKDPLLISALSCQCISNVPSAILLSGFTDQYPALLLGVNIGGTGTMIASLASLITFRQYTTVCPNHAKKYLLEFSLFNFSFLILLILLSEILFRTGIV